MPVSILPSSHLAQNTGPAGDPLNGACPFHGLVIPGTALWARLGSLGHQSEDTPPRSCVLSHFLRPAGMIYFRSSCNLLQYRHFYVFVIHGPVSRVCIINSDSIILSFPIKRSPAVINGSLQTMDNNHFLGFIHNFRAVSVFKADNACSETPLNPETTDLAVFGEISADPPRRTFCVARGGGVSSARLRCCRAPGWLAFKNKTASKCVDY